MSLANALSELRDEVIAGAAAEDAAAQVAADNDVHPALLIRKWRESHPSDEGVRANAAASNPATCFKQKLEDKIATICSRYRVSVEGCAQVTFKGKVYTVIGRKSQTHFLAVDHETFQAWNLPVRGCRSLDKAA